MHEQSSWPHSPRVKPLQAAQMDSLCSIPSAVPCCDLPAATFPLLLVPAGSTHQTSPWQCQLQAQQGKVSLPRLLSTPESSSILDFQHCFAESVTGQTQRSQIFFSYLSNPQGEWSSRGRHRTKPSMFHFLAR